MSENELTSKAVSVFFTKALKEKSSTKLYTLIDQNCQWHVGSFIGTLMGTDECVGYFQKIFNSYKNLNFLSRVVSCSPVSATIEYRLDENTKGRTTLEEFTGVFILYINSQTSKIELIKSYYEDRTQRRVKPAVVSRVKKETRRATASPRDTVPPHDPVTGLPLQ